MGETRIFEGTANINTTNVREDPQEITFTLTATQRQNGAWDLTVDRQGTLVEYRDCHLPDDRHRWEKQALDHIKDCFSHQVMAILVIRGTWQ